MAGGNSIKEEREEEKQVAVMLCNTHTLDHDKQLCNTKAKLEIHVTSTHESCGCSHRLHASCLYACMRQHKHSCTLMHTHTASHKALLFSITRKSYLTRYENRGPLLDDGSMYKIFLQGMQS